MSEDTPLLQIRTNNDQRLNIEPRPNDGQKTRPLTIWTKFDKRFDKDILTPAVGRRSWYHDYTTIDWLHDMIKDKMRLSSLADKGFLKRKFDAAQAWIVLTIVGMLCGLTASFIYVSINWLTDIRSGYCMDDWRLTRSACCSTSECLEWNYWVRESYEPMLNTITATALALIACIPVTLAVYKSDSNKFYYYSAGSGIPQVKTILGGFVIRGCLGLRTLLVKSVSLILTVSSGLMMGQQGPIVHISCCIGNVVSRIFSKYSMNDAKRREILSAASAAGVSVAFGAPIGGVLFSLEEVSYYFPPKTMWRSFYCALIAAMTLKYTNPDKYLLFESHIDADWNSFDIIFFVIIGLFGGIFGAFFIASSRAILKFEKSQGIYFKFLRVLIVSALTAYLSYLLPYNEISNNQLITFLFSQCNSASSNVICEISNEKFGTFFISWITMAFLMIITYGIHLPGGIFVPSMVVGALGGRITALLAQNLATNLVNIKIEPAIYAMVGAASTISGVTRMTVSLIIIMFEITGSLRHVVPLMIAIMVSKWSSDALEKDSIYDTCIKLLEYPYLDHKRAQLISASLDTVMEVSVPIIQMDREYTVYELELKLEDLKVRFPSGDGGFPVLTSQNILKGYVRISDLEHALYIIQQKRIDWEYLPIVIPHSTTSYKEVFDISAWIDRSPIMVTSDTPLELVLELFMKLVCGACSQEATSRRLERVLMKARSGLAALEDLYSDTTNITIMIGKFTFAAHREYLSRYPFFAELDLSMSSISITLPVPTKFVDCLVHMYIQEEGLLMGFQEGLFIEASFVDTLRNAIYLGLSSIVKECYRRFYGIWKTVIFQKEFNVENISLDHIQKLVENARPQLKDEEKALIILQWSLRRDDRINALIARYASTQNDLTPFLELINSFPKEKPLYIPVPKVSYDDNQISIIHSQDKKHKKRRISTSPSSNSDGRGRSRSVRDRSPMYSPSQSIEKNDYRNGKSPRYYNNSDLDPSYYKPTSPIYSPGAPQ